MSKEIVYLSPVALSDAEEDFLINTNTDKHLVSASWGVSSIQNTLHKNEDVWS